MEPSESDSVAVSNDKDPQLGSEQPPPSPPGAHSPPSDLNLTAEGDALGEELQNKCDLKCEEEGGAETEDKVANFDDGGGICDEESGKGEVCDGDSRGWETNCWNEDVNDEVGRDEVEQKEEITHHRVILHHKCDLKCEEEGGAETEDKVANFDDGGGVCDEESGKGEVCDGDSRGWETNSWNEDVNDDVGRDEVEQREEQNSGRRTHHYPLRPEAEDCAFYMKTGNCKFGFNCKFNHPIRRRNQAVTEKVGEREEPTERSSPTECKYYQRSGGCKFGKACKYNHTRGKSSTAPILELNFLGLPIRLGERECPYYMRTGSCKFGANCRFNHPDPTDVGGCDPPSGYGNGGSVSLQGVSQSSVPSWSSPSTLNETSFVPMMLSPTQGVSPQSSDWNGYQASVYLSERSMHSSSTYVMNNPAIETYMHHQKQIPVEEFPERPGEPECSYFLKTGDCKFKSNCKFHHPKNRVARLPPCNLSDKGLPLRPDQSVCSHYSRYGICKFGPACKFDHPDSPSLMMMPGLGQQSYSNSASVEVARMGGSAGATDATIQQSV